MNASVKETNTCDRGRDLEDECDLGLGDGLKPGALHAKKMHQYNKQCVLSRQSHREDSYSDSDVASGEITSKTDRFVQRLTRRQKVRRIYNKRKSTETDISDGFILDDLDKLSISPDFTSDTLAKLTPETIKNDINGMLLQRSSIKEFKGGVDGLTEVTELGSEEVKTKLIQAQQEVELLKQDLELCEKQLSAKYKAIQILQGHVLTGGRKTDKKKGAAINSHEQEEKNDVIRANRELQKQINAVQFEMEYRQSCLLTSQELWTHRFDRVCAENKQLQSALDEKAAENKRLHAGKMTLSRERDELLALVDIRERQRFGSKPTSQSSDDSATVYNNYTTKQLAVLGACHCRVKDPEPCTCAHAAATLDMELTAARKQIQQREKSLEETSLLADAYRRAFEEQLTRNRDLIGRLGQLTLAPPSTAEKAKATVKWLIKQLNEDESILPRSRRAPGSQLSRDPSAYDTDIEQLFAEVRETAPTEGLEAGNVLSPNGEGGDLVSGVDLETQTDQQLLNLLIELVSDKTEALVHSRLAARLLAKRNKELQQQLRAFTDNSEEVLTSS